MFGHRKLLRSRGWSGYLSQIMNDVRSIFQYCLSSKNKLTNQVETQNSGHEKVNECR